MVGRIVFISIVLCVKEIFENWRQVVNKNKNTKPTKQVKTAGDSTNNNQGRMHGRLVS